MSDTTTNQESTAPQPTEEFIKKAEVARRLQCSVRTIDRWARAGLVPFYKVGRKAILFKWSEVEAQMRKSCRRS